MQVRRSRPRRCVLQAYRRRTLSDIDHLPDEGAGVRLCKGIGVEPRWVTGPDLGRGFVR